MKLTKFTLACIVGILVLIVIAYIDTAGVIILGYKNYTAGNFPIEFWHHFRNTAIILMLIPALLYYFFTKDKSESLAIFLIPFIGFWTGITDILYFWLQKRQVPQILNHLNMHPVIGRITYILGFSNVTNISLYISAIIGAIIIFFTVKYLKEKI